MCCWRRSGRPYLRCWEGIVYFAFVIDVYSRKVVGWQFTDTCATSSSRRCKMALGLRAPGVDVELAHHSDAGSLPSTPRPSTAETLDDHGDSFKTD